MNRQAALDAVRSTVGMSYDELDELGRKVSLSACPPTVQRIIFKAIENRRSDLLAQEATEGAMVVCAEIEADD